MNTIDYKKLISYKLALVAADLTWEFAPRYYDRLEDSRQRDQMNQAARSDKQNIAEGSSTASLSIKLNLYNAAKASAKELLEDYEDILRRENLPRWDKTDPRLARLRFEVENYSPAPSSKPSNSSNSSYCSSSFPNLIPILEKVRRIRGLREVRGIRGPDKELEEVINYAIDVLTRDVALLDRQIAAVEEKHKTEGGYRETLLKKRLSFRSSLRLLLLPFLLISLFFELLLLPSSSLAFAANSGIFTASEWVNPSTSVASKALIGKAEEFRVFTDASGYAGCQIKSTTWQTAAQATTNALALNTWSFVACTYDKVTLRVFVNGVQVGSQALTATIDDTAAAILLGQDSSASTPYGNLSGVTDEFKFYNYARTADQIMEDMTARTDSGVSQQGVVAGGGQKTPVGWWKFDEGQGITAHDASSNGNDGTLTNMSSPATATSGWSQNGKFGKALAFDGSNDRVTVSSSSFPTGAAARTFSAWVYPTANSIGINDIIDSGTTTASQRFSLDRSSTNTIYFAGQANDITGTLSIPNNAWSYVAATYDGTTVNLYVNGVKDPASTTKTLNTTGSSVNIGSLVGGGNGENFTGTIDEVKIYPYALTSDEVKTEYNHGSAIQEGGIAPQDSAQSPSNLTSGLVGWWKMDENTGVGTTDSSGSGNNGTLAGDTIPTWTSGKFGPGLSFNGGSSYVNVGDKSSLEFGVSTDKFSVSAWVKLTSTPTGNVAIVSKYNSDSKREYALNVNTSSQPYLILSEDGGGTNMRTETSSTALTANQWAYVTATIDFASDVYDLYVNGSKVTTTDSGPLIDTLYTGSAAFYIGAVEKSTVAPTGFFPGSLDDVRVYNRALSPKEIEDLYNWAPGPVASWNFEEATGTTVADGSGNNNTGTWNGTGAQHWTTGKIGKAGKFNGTDDVVTVTDSANLRVESALFTVETWIKPNTVRQQMIIFKSAANFSGSGWGLTMNHSGSNINLVKMGVADQEVSYTFSPNTWYHVAAVQSASSVQYFINGSSIGTFSNASAYQSSTGQDLRIGGGNTFSSQFDGSIDQVRVFNYARTPAQIAFDYNGGGPVGYWKFDECQGTTAMSSSGLTGGSSLDGTITIGATGTQSSVGNCGVGDTSTAWYNGRTGKYNSSLKLDGTDDAVTTAASSPFTGTGTSSPTSSWGGWFYPMTSATSKTLIEKASEVRLITDGSSKPQCGLYYAGAFHNATAGSSALTLNAWNHLLCTADGANIKTYLNGNLIGTTAETHQATGASSILYFGKSSGGTGFFEGQVDDVRIYNYALTPSQVKNVYNQGSAIRFGPSTGTP